MSADKYSVCPNCVTILEKKLNKIHFDIGLKYGKVEPQEYLNLVKNLEKEEKYVLEFIEGRKDKTLREDFEIGIDPVGYEVKYKAYCHICNFTFENKFEKLIDFKGAVYEK